MARLPIKSSVLTVRVAPEVKASLQSAAIAERRSLANMLEVAVLAYCSRFKTAKSSLAIKEKKKRVSAKRLG
jgi:predicted transcriptional regulator